jgi:hypothetical protein
LFVTLTYPEKVTANDHLLGGATTVRLADVVALVAMKNGMHRSEGYAHFSAGVAALAPAAGAHVKALHQTIHAFFNSQPQAAADASRQTPAELTARTIAHAAGQTPDTAALKPAAARSPAAVD